MAEYNKDLVMALAVYAFNPDGTDRLGPHGNPVSFDEIWNTSFMGLVEEEEIVTRLQELEREHPDRTPAEIRLQLREAMEWLHQQMKQVPAERRPRYDELVDGWTAHDTKH
jgi:hypothetical protein